MALELIWGAGYTNVAWRDYTGVPVERWRDAVVPEDLTRCTTALVEAQRLGHPVGCDARLRTGATDDGRWFRVVFAPGAGDVWFACAHDIEARFTGGRARRWIATVSHELRAPLATLLLWERVLRDPAIEPERRAQALEAIRDCAEAQSRIVEDLVQLSRSTAGTLRVETRRVDLFAIIRAAVAAAALAGQARRVAVTVEGGDEPCVVRGDPQRLRQILDNVLLNSLKFSYEDGSVAVTVRVADGAARVTVSDQGEGIAADLLPHVFQPFTGTSGGLGLGLAIAHELAVLHGGSLEARSAGPGRGAAFTLALPVAGDALDFVEKPPPTVLDGVRVLVVDDDPRVRDALEILLGRAGAAVVATTAHGATAALATYAPDVVVCDPALPRSVVTANVPVIPIRRPCDLEVLLSEIHRVTTPD